MTVEQQQALALARARRRRAEQEAVPEAKPEKSIGQKAIDVGGGLLRGAGSIGATLLTPYDYAVGNTKSLGNPERREAMTNALGSLGVDTDSGWFKAGKLGGEIAGTLGVPVASAARFSYAPRAALNALSGGAAAGVVNPEEAATGAMLGGGLTALGAPLVYAGQQAYKRIIDPAMNLVRKDGATNIVRNYLRDVVGEANVPTTVAAARKAEPAIGGYQQRLDEAMTHQVRNPVTGKNELAFIPEGSPLSKVTQTEAAQPGGASAKFGKRLQEQDLALEAAEKARDVAAKPLRDAAMKAADTGGGVDAAPISAKIAEMLDKPANYGAPGVKDVLYGVKSDLDDIIARGVNGRVEAEAIYALRKDIGKKISSVANSKNITFDKGLSAKLEAEIQLAIDGEINNAIRSSGIKDIAPGVTVYDRYMNNFAKASEEVRLTKEARELAAKPPQPTNISGGKDVAKELTPQIGQMLSRPVMMSNWTLRILGKAKEPEVDRVLTNVLLNPNEYAKIMSQINPKSRAQVNKLLEAARNPLIVGTTAYEQ